MRAAADKAAKNWNRVGMGGITFQRVDRREDALFDIVYGGSLLLDFFGSVIKPYKHLIETHQNVI